jgi:hypothetical protein
MGIDGVKGSGVQRSGLLYLSPFGGFVEKIDKKGVKNPKT